MGKDVIRETLWDPAKPNRLALTLNGGVKVTSLIGTSVAIETFVSKFQCIAKNSIV